MAGTVTSPLPLSTRQIIIAATLGTALWLAAALLLNALKDTGIYAGATQVFLFAAIIPGTAPFIWVIAKLAGLVKGQIALATALAVGVATVLDACALTWFPDLYGGSDYAAGAGATILWGAGVSIGLGFTFDHLSR